jgi:hypothetical protein
VGSTNRRTAVQPGLGNKQDPISKITNTKRAGRVAQVVKCQSSKLKALNLTFSIRTTTTKFQKTKKLRVRDAAVVEYLLGMHKVLGLIPSIAKKFF